LVLLRPGRSDNHWFGLQRTTMKIMVIGGGGLIGTKFCRSWLSQSCLFPIFPGRMSAMRTTIMTLIAVAAFANNCSGQAVRLDRRPPKLLGAQLSGKEVVAGGSSVWQDRPAKNGRHLVCLAGPGKGFYLAYDPEGKSNALTLSPQAGPGTVWRFLEGDQKRLADGHRQSVAVATPLTGPLAGFEITVVDNKVVLRKAQTGLRFKVYYDNLEDGK
jgi:hypothetical protein